MQHNNIPSEVRSHHLCHILLIKACLRAIPHSRRGITLGTNNQKAQITGVCHRICTPFRCISIFSCVNFLTLPYCLFVFIYIKSFKECLTHNKGLINVRYCFQWVVFIFIFFLLFYYYVLLVTLFLLPINSVHTSE